MASTSVSRVLPASPQQVWDLIGGFDALPDWLPYIPESVSLEGGRVRRLTNPDGDVIVERLVGFDETERSYTYAILEAPFPVTGYLSTLRVHAIPGRPDAAEVQWSGRFVPNGATESEVIDLFTGIYADGLEALHKALTASSPATTPTA
ncbi:SRPBCC family protein [Streptomyces sp. NPDC004267]|uniref:SRPBCC family protein n=1 Tax=Streptomyces sp. NPDC004267 TaxID=3364694 RepID=UPI0036B3BC02